MRDTQVASPESLPSSPESAMSLSPESSPTPSPACRSQDSLGAHEDDDDEGRGEESRDNGGGAVAGESADTYQATFLTALRNGDYQELRDIVIRGRGSVNVNCFDERGETALHQSCRSGNLDLVKLLVRNGADTRLATRDGWSALHIAAFSGYQDIMVYLISHPPAR